MFRNLLNPTQIRSRVCRTVKGPTGHIEMTPTRPTEMTTQGNHHASLVLRRQETTLLLYTTCLPVYWRIVSV